MALLGGQQYVTQDLQKQGEVPSVSPPLNITHNCTELEKLSIPHASDKIAPNNLPHVRGHFVGRDSELREISHMLIHSTYSGVAMVSIYGAPAVGKSTLANKVGHQLAGHGIVVRYVNVNEAHNLFVENSETVNGEPSSSTTTNISSQSTDVTSHSSGGVLAIPWYSFTEKKYVLTSPRRLMEWVKALVNDTLLILDNCDDLLQRNKTQESKFKEVLRALLEASNYLRIVTTSRARIVLLDGFRPYPLKELDPISAVHLLQLQSSLISGEEGKVIAELVGNNPLGLGIVAGLVNEKIRPPCSIIEDLKQQAIETLNQAILPKSQQILTVLQLSYKYLHGRLQMCSQYLSHFPGSFHRDAALNILGKCNFSDSEHCLETLTQRSFLEEYWCTCADQPRYQFHRLIREFLQYIQSECRDDHIETEFSLYYQRYYSQSIAILSQLYRRNSYSNEIINSLECDTHNFLNVFQKMAKLQLDTKSVLNIAYGISNGTNLFLEILDCNDCFAILLKALIGLFDQKIFEFSQEIGLIETTLLYFNLSSVAKEWLFKFNARFCMTKCMEMFANHYSMVEKLSTAESNTLDSYCYYPFACYLDCSSSSHYIIIIYFTMFFTMSWLSWIFYSKKFNINDDYKAICIAWMIIAALLFICDITWTAIFALIILCSGLKVWLSIPLVWYVLFVSNLMYINCLVVFSVFSLIAKLLIYDLYLPSFLFSVVGLYIMIKVPLYHNIYIYYGLSFLLCFFLMGFYFWMVMYNKDSQKKQAQVIKHMLY